ncbi:hypothetical protein [Maricaulis maris]|uniref:hypothetical protein n=1 Tax=Maricaulis maris TaxID=74318 RepID=UPI003B8BDD8D
MRLRTRNGQLSLGSIYKLFVVGWTFTWTLLFAFAFVLMILISLTGAPLTVNGAPVSGVGALLAGALPLVLFLPVMAFMQALIFGGFFVLAMMIYRSFRPITVETDMSRVFS